jgi:ADP-heptose:LPS heptosyltransferase
MSVQKKLGDAPRILIVRMSALGDVIHGLPVACALREAFPGAFLGWVVEGRNAELLADHPVIDKIVAVPRRWWRSPRNVLDLRRQLRALQFDVTIDLQCLTKSAMAAWLSGARRRIGKAGVHGRELSKWINNDLIPVGGRHVIDHYLELLRPLGVETPAVEFRLPENGVDARMIDSLLAAEQLAPGRLVVLNPGAGWPSKIWPPQCYGEIARRILADYGLAAIAVWGGPNELPLAEQIVAASGGAARLAPPTTIPQLAALCRRAALFLGSDTGPMHLAVAVGAPTISLHGPSIADWCGAYGADNIRLQARYEAGSALERRRADDSAMRAITVEAAYAACRQLLDRRLHRQCG